MLLPFCHRIPVLRKKKTWLLCSKSSTNFNSGKVTKWFRATATWLILLMKRFSYKTIENHKRPTPWTPPKVGIPFSMYISVAKSRLNQSRWEVPVESISALGGLVWRTWRTQRLKKNKETHEIDIYIIRVYIYIYTHELMISTKIYRWINKKLTHITKTHVLKNKQKQKLQSLIQNLQSNTHTFKRAEKTPPSSTFRDPMTSPTPWVALRRVHQRHPNKHGRALRPGSSKRFTT